MESPIQIKSLTPNDLELMAGVRDCFCDAFEEQSLYKHKSPSKGYLKKLLASDNFFCIAAINENKVIGALTAYELVKYEQERSEIYIYDLAVHECFRRQGIATKLIENLKTIARKRNAWVVFVQAEYGDDPAIALYNKLGTKESVLHFDISIN